MFGTVWLVLSWLYLSSLPFSSAQQVQRRIVKARTFPFDVLVVLPAFETLNDKYGLTIDKARPVIEYAVEEAVKKQYVPPNWIRLSYEDSRFWEDSTLAERHAANAVIKAHCAGHLDAVLGLADEYSLATVAKISAGFNKGIPVITTTGLNSALGAKKSFPYLTRMQGSFEQIASAVYDMIAYKGANTTSTNSLSYQNFVFLYHDKRRGVNNPSNGDRDETPSSHCYFTMYAIKTFFTGRSPFFKDLWKHQAAHVAFDEGRPRSRKDMTDWLKQASNDSNGKCHPAVYCSWEMSIGEMCVCRSVNLMNPIF